MLSLKLVAEDTALYENNYLGILLAYSEKGLMF